MPDLLSNTAFKLHQLPTVERLSTVFSELSGIITPTLTAGSVAFLKEFGSWVQTYRSPTSGIRMFISPNPSHSLAFPTPLEDIHSSLEIASEYGLAPPSLDELLLKFNLDIDTCRQPTYTLSGGELALITLAKCFTLLPGAVSSVFCSPSRWLHQSRRPLIFNVLAQCNRDAEPAAFLCLDGELDSGDSDSKYSSLLPTSLEPICWTLTTNRLSVEFPARKFPAVVPSKRMKFNFHNDCLKILSPTIITGDNGVGKSTFAKMLSHLIKPAEGSVSTNCYGFTTTPRLVLQESIHQLLAMDPLHHIDWVYKYDSSRRDLTLQVFNQLQKRAANIVSVLDSTTTIGNDTQPNTFIQAKLALVAERLVCGSKILILDEPSWGFSQTQATAFLIAVIKQAQEHEIAVVVISHDDRIPSELFFNEIKMERGKSPSDIMLSVGPYTPSVI